MNTKTIENWLETTIGFENTRPGLSRVNFAIDLLDLKPMAKVITIAGTNGKGSTTRGLAKALATQHTTAWFTSPHLKSITERFHLNNQEIPLEELFELLKKIEKDVREAGGFLSYFEILFIGFLYWIKDKNCEFIVLEVGLGGRFDATNSIDADLAVITSIARDHEELLGHRYAMILGEKIGISRKDRPLITCFPLDYLNKQVELHQKHIGFNWINLSPKNKINFIETNKILIKNALSYLNIKADLIEEASSFSYAGAELYFYGSHNPEAVRKLVQLLEVIHYNKQNMPFDLIFLSFSKRKKKDIGLMIQMFKALNRDNSTQIILTAFEHFKSSGTQVLEELALENGIEFVANYKNKFINIENKKILFSGSNYFIGDIMSELNL